jgi:catechol 2,3-dioxygenase-like lactoylglutathione lyase family enzyme
MRLAALLVPMLLPMLAQAQAAPPFEAVAGSFFALSVADIGASTKWYTEKLGLRSIMRVPKQPGQPAVEVLTGGGLTVEIQQHDNAAPAQRAPAERQGIFKVGIVVKDFDATLASIRARGIPIAMGPWPKRADQPAQVIVRDTSGTFIQFLGQ